MAKDIELSSDDDFQPEQNNGGTKKYTKKSSTKSAENDHEKSEIENELFGDSDDSGKSEEKSKSKKSRKRPMRQRSAKEESKAAKKKKNDAGSEDSEFEPSDDEEDGDSESSGDKSDNLTDDAISDSDFIPDSDEEDPGGNNTIDITSDGDNSPQKDEKTQTFDPNSKEFWNKVEELKNKGFSIQQTSAQPAKGPNPAARRPPPQNGQQNNKLSAFSQLYISFEHEKRCIKKCFMMEGRQKQTLREVNSAHWLTPDFIKACIRTIYCCVRIGDIPTAREGIELVKGLGNISGISALSQAMISGCKVHEDDLEDLEKTEREAIEAMKTKLFTKALELLDKVLTQSSGCIRVKMTRGDCLAHLGRYVDGAKAASSILVHDQKNVSALFLRGFCLYHKDNIDRAVTHFQQVLQLSKDHARSKALLGKANQFREMKEQAVKAVKVNNIQRAISIYTDALEVDPRNKGTCARLLASRAELHAQNEDYESSIEDCEKSLELDTACLVAMVQRGKCFMKQHKWDLAVRDFERVNNRDRHNQQNKKKAGDAALKAGNHDEAFRMYQEALAVDKHNQTYRHLLKTAKEQLAKLSRKDFYGVLGLENTCTDSEIRKAYFKKSKEYHPDRHANAEEAELEEMSNKFKLVKEAYETLSDPAKKETFDTGAVKPPPGGWYQDLDPKIMVNVHPRGGLARGRGGIIRGGIRGFPARGGVRGAAMVVRGNPRGGRVMNRGMVRGAPINVQFRGGVGQRPPLRMPVRGTAPVRVRGGPVRGQMNGRGGIRPGMRPAGIRPGMRPAGMRPGGMRPGMRPVINRGGIRPGMVRPAAMNGKPRPNLPSSVTITPMSEVTIDD